MTSNRRKKLNKKALSKYAGKMDELINDAVKTNSIEELVAIMCSTLGLIAETFIAGNKEAFVEDCGLSIKQAAEIKSGAGKLAQTAIAKAMHRGFK